MASCWLAEVLMSNDQNPFPASGIGPATGVAIIGETMRIQGTLTSREEVHLNGHCEGQMEVDGRLTIGTSGNANANIKAGEVIIAGSAKGNVETVGRLVLRAGASLEGDVKAAGIVIEDGAYFKGGVDITRPPSS
jgi:cytoskeletal protein CcmA (bactofilin family)